MHQFAKRIFAAAAPLLLTGCLWGPGKFTSDLTLKKDGGFVLDYKGEIVLQTPPDKDKPERAAWTDNFAHCYADGSSEMIWDPAVMKNRPGDDKRKARPCTKSEVEKARVDYEKQAVEQAEQLRKSQEEMAKLFGLPGLDDESARAFAIKLANMPVIDPSSIAGRASTTSTITSKAERLRTSSSPRFPTTISSSRS